MWLTLSFEVTQAIYMVQLHPAMTRHLGHVQSNPASVLEIQMEPVTVRPTFPESQNSGHFIYLKWDPSQA